MDNWHDQPYLDLEDDFSESPILRKPCKSKPRPAPAKASQKSSGAWKFWIQVAIVLVLIGAVNWFVVSVTGFSNPNNSFDLIKPTLGPIWVYLPYIVYLIIGVAGFVLIWALIARGMKSKVQSSKKIDLGNDWDLGY